MLYLLNFQERKITKTVELFAPDGSPAQGTMDVKMLPDDPNGYGYNPLKQWYIKMTDQSF